MVPKYCTYTLDGSQILYIVHTERFSNIVHFTLICSCNCFVYLFACEERLIPGCWLLLKSCKYNNLRLFSCNQLLMYHP